MPAVVRLGDTCSGHECFPSRQNVSGSQNVFVNAKPAVRVGDAWDIHSCTHPEMPHGSHAGTQAGGSSTVYVNGRKLARVGDSISCGSSCSNGSSNVFAG